MTTIEAVASPVHPLRLHGWWQQDQFASLDLLSWEDTIESHQVNKDLRDKKYQTSKKKS